MFEINRRSLWILLKSWGVPLTKWGRGEAKTIDHLLAELMAGEIVLGIDNTNNLVIRRVSTAAIDVYYADPKTATVVLVEDRQVFKDGRIRKRHLSTSLGEKMKAGEDPEAAVKRALKEELGIEEVASIVPGEKTRGPLHPSLSFPGIYTENSLHRFDVFISARLYQPEGYVEKQPDKETYFIWTQANAPR